MSGLEQNRQDDQNSIKALVDQLFHAWNNRDRAGFYSLLPNEVYYKELAGNDTTGYLAENKGTVERMASGYPGTDADSDFSITLPMKVKWIRDDVAFVDVVWQNKRKTTDEQAVTREGSLEFVASKEDGKWVISVGLLIYH
jgi:uncharacterized protein (TIGR02246 family)